MGQGLALSESLSDFVERSCGWIKFEVHPDRLTPGPVAAVGPASVPDVQAWSGLTALRSMLESMRPNLIIDKERNELFDLPDALRWAETFVF